MIKRTALALLAPLTMLAACARAETAVTALAVEINPEDPAMTACFADILGYDPVRNTLTVELIARETFAGEDLLGLQPGDGIYAWGREIAVRSAEYRADDGVFVINGGEGTDGAPPEDRLWFLEELTDRGVDFVHMEDGGSYVFNSVAVIECPVRDTLLFLDYISEEWGYPRELPLVRGAEELKALLLDEARRGDLSMRNVYVTFDAEGGLATVHRYYVPWQ
ncbi:MAG: hypothetical protein IJS53_00210 [Clostridia bacterium]|nr:hypothetical protein [Clostridia bacterium]